MWKWLVEIIRHIRFKSCRSKCMDIEIECEPRTPTKEDNTQTITV